MAKHDKDNPTIFDFSNITDATKSALALSYEAVKEHMDVLPDEIVEFYKSADDQLDFGVIAAAKAEDEKKENKDKKKAPGDEEEEEDEDKDKAKDKKKKADEIVAEKNAERNAQLITAIKSALPGAVTQIQSEAVAPLKVEIEKNRTEIATLVGRLEREEMVEIAKSLMPNGDKPSEEKVAELMVIRKGMDDKQWAAYLEGRKSDVAIIEKAALFERQSNPGATAPASAYAELKGIADSLVEKSEIKDAQAAFEAAIHMNPSIYDRYVKEQAAQAKS